MNYVKAIVRLETGQVGTDATEAWLVPEAALMDHINGTVDYKNDRVADAGWQLALDNAEMYGIYPMSDKQEDEDEEDGEYWKHDEYSEDIGYTWELYNPEEHDGLVPGGGEWEWREIY